MQIRYNLAQIEQWARDKKIHDERTQAIDAFIPLIQAAQLLQVGWKLFQATGIE